MAQQRDPPAFQEYPASILARADFRVASAASRGFLMTVRFECWVNRSVPRDPHLLSKILGFDLPVVEQGLAELGSFFSIEGDEIRCPELDHYRAHLDERRQKQSAGGKAGAAKTNEGRNRPSTTSPTGTPRLACSSLVKQSPVQSSKDESLEGKASEDSWLSDYDRASRGH